MNHRASPRFWALYHALPAAVRALADRSFAQLRDDPTHPSLRFRPVGAYWSARIGLHYRALAVRNGNEFAWFWIGTHAEYDGLLGR